MGGGGIQHHRIGIIDHTHRLAGGVIGQTQKGNVRFVQHFFTGGRILAVFLRQSKKLNIGAVFQPFSDSETGGSGTTVYKYLFHLINSSINAICAATDSGPVPPAEMRLETQVSSEISL